MEEANPDIAAIKKHLGISDENSVQWVKTSAIKELGFTDDQIKYRRNDDNSKLDEIKRTTCTITICGTEWRYTMAY